MNFDTTDIITVARFSYKNYPHVTNHCHNFYHLLYITGGSGILRVQGEVHQALEDDCYLFAPGILHELLSDRQQPMTTLEVKFLTEEPDLINGLNALPLPFSNRNMSVKPMLEYVVEEALSKTPYYKQMIKLHLLKLLISLIRDHDANRAGEADVGQAYTIHEEQYSQELVNKVLRYIHLHYTEQLTLTDLAREFNINPAYICRIFGKKYDISPIQYANNLKLQKVKELLVRTEKSITEISEATGFSSIHYLSRYFTAKEKVTPHEYRKRSKNAIHIKVEDKYRFDVTMEDKHRIVNYKLEASY